MIFASFVRYRYLIWQLTKREVVGRYRGSFFGLIWSLINPLLLLGIYTFVFGFVFQARFGTHASGGRIDYAIILFTGLILHQFLSECITRSTVLITDNPNYAKKVIFPLEVLSWSCMFAALFHLFVSLFVLLLFNFFVHHAFHLSIFLFPVVLLPLVILAIGLCWFLSALGVFVRDVSQIMNFIVMILLFLSPIFYPVTNLPSGFRWAIYLNPLTFIVIQARKVLIWGQMPNWLGLLGYLIIAGIIAYLGLFWFNKTRHGFADVL